MNQEPEVPTSVEVTKTTTKTTVDEEHDTVIAFLYPFECDECREEITSDSVWMTHLLTRNSKCHLCGAPLSGHYHLESHMLSVHRLHQCTLCMKYYTTRSSLSRHMVVHDPNPPHYECDVCHVKFIRKAKLERHLISNHHDELLKQVYICEKCGKKFFEQWNLSMHMLVHEVNGYARYPYTCEVCDRRFLRRDTLRKHLRQIHDVRADQPDKVRKFSLVAKTGKKHIRNVAEYNASV